MPACGLASRSRVGGAGAALVVGALLAGTFVTAGPAEAAYRYWSYWRTAPGATGWTYASTGPSYRVPDGAVEGWRFQHYGAGNPSDPPPRSTASFAEICQSVAPVDGMKRVAIAVDFGADGGVGHSCVRIPTSGSGEDALAQRAQQFGRPAPRYNNSGLLCAIDGRPPAPECGKQVESPKPSPTTARPSTSPSLAATPGASSSPAAPPRQTAGTQTSRVAATAASAALPTSSETLSAAPSPAPRVSASAPSAAPSARGDALVLEAPSAKGADEGGGSPLPTVVGAALVLALAGAAALRMRSGP